MSVILHTLELQQKLRHRLEASTSKVFVENVEHTAADFTQKDWLSYAKQILGPVTISDLDKSEWLFKHEQDAQDLDGELLGVALFATTQVQKAEPRNVHVSVWTTQGVRGVAVTIEGSTWRQRLFCNGKAVTDETAPLKEVLNALQ